MAGGTTGIFVMVEPSGVTAHAIREVQLQWDPRLAREAPPHVTLVGSSGAGPIDASVPLAELRDTLGEVVERHRPFAVEFGPPQRLGERTVVALPLDPHGPLRALHEDLRASGLPMAASRWPFTPHCTLSFYPELTREQLRALTRVRVEHPLQVQQLRVYHTREVWPPRHLFDLLLGALPPD